MVLDLSIPDLCLFLTLYVKTVLLYFNRFTVRSQLNTWNISADGVLKSACNIIRAARFWNSDILSKIVSIIKK